MEICFFPEQQAGDLNVIAIDRASQRSVAKGITGVDSGATVQQRLSYFHAASPGGHSGLRDGSLR